MEIGLSTAESSAPPPPSPYPPGAPNVLVIVLDDLGFAQLGCYGSDIDTPNLDRLAERGLRFTNFHTTAVCSPTRACLLTGRNHHRVGMGMLPDLPMNFPGYTGEFPESAGTLAEVLRASGWSTTAIGKWHLTPRDQRSSGPYDMWPTGVGFERYYGFLNGETNQWTPNLICDQTHIEPPATPEEGYHLDADLADQAIDQLRQLRLDRPQQPFFMYYATGTPHAPHQAPPEWIDRYRGRFDEGWDAWRETVLARQKELGVVPSDVELSERPDWVEAWDDIDAERRALYSRMMEVFAGFMSHADHHIGRVIDHLDSTGDLDNTVVLLISDNGASAEGGPNGAWNQHRHYTSDEPDDIDEELRHIDELGGHRSSCHYPWGWALAGNTPFRRWKRYTFEGGVRDPMIVSWPGCTDPGGVRDQYCHVTDVMPTILDILGVDVPHALNGIEQMSLDGKTLGPVLDSGAAAATRTSQYYECWGSRAIYADGWKAVTNHVNQLTAAERDNIVGSDDFAADEWELFDTRTDFTESVDLAAAEPTKLAELVALWDREAERNSVLPLDDTGAERMAYGRLPWMEFRDTHHLKPGDKVHEASGPLLMGTFRVVAGFDPGLQADASGVILEQGDWISGWACFLDRGELRVVFNIDGREHRLAGAVPLGTRLLVVEATPADGGLDVSLSADAQSIASEHFGRLTRLFPLAPDGAFLTVGYGRPFPVCDDYEPPAPAPDALTGVTITTGSPPPLDFDEEFERMMRHQ